jgi:3-oxoacyl-[acyl-carrier protein] reductase
LDDSLKSKVAIVTGATRGIGRAIALELAGHGVNVAFNYLQSVDAAKALEVELKKLGAPGLAVRCDVRDLDASKGFVEQVKERFERLDILVNNAGVTRDKAFMMMDRADWLEVIDTNLNGYFNMARSVIVTFLKQKSGNIVNISSVSGVSGIARQVNYSASKAGIIGMTKALAKEVAGYGIRVNCVAPGFIETDMVKDLKPELKEKFLGQIPLGHFGAPEDVAKTVGFLLSERSQYITGQVIKVDGGLHTSG